MTRRTTDDWHGCPIRYGAAIFGDKWCLLVLRDLVFKGAKYYADFLNAGEGISTNILASRLVALEAEGIIMKRPDPDHGSRSIFSLTEKGIGLIPALLEIVNWAEVWDKKTDVPQVFAKELRTNRQALAKRLGDNHRVTKSA